MYIYKLTIDNHIHLKPLIKSMQGFTHSCNNCTSFCHVHSHFPPPTHTPHPSPPPVECITKNPRFTPHGGYIPTGRVHTPRTPTGRYAPSKDGDATSPQQSYYPPLHEGYGSSVHSWSSAAGDQIKNCIFEDQETIKKQGQLTLSLPLTWYSEYR